MGWGGVRVSRFFYLHDSSLGTVTAGDSIARQLQQGDLLIVKCETANEQRTECI